MQDWKQTLHATLGLPSQDLNFYRDLFLVAPIVLFAITGSAHLFGADNEKMLAWKCLAIAAYGVFLARERVLLILGGLGFCALRFLLGLAFTQNWRLFLGLAATGLPFLLALRFARKYKPSYSWPTNLDAVANSRRIRVIIAVYLEGFSNSRYQPLLIVRGRHISRS